ncbi:hypothetical protein MmiAt1_02860 [Methanimicrococcus sp. At1]|uniref:DUF4367 domain-containing protein n=1 Tax=Methanimicrococcus hacksteinii TaxID=3028293 RepID=A0ABU3VMX1_9EURY|nr:DUF4367 domain-containing protein [Methanimicrococcus sp. At1]MDV0444749.1 hypothetical protein [Methanimicrococcus sp. At1]
MKKSILIVLLVALLAVAVGVSGCLGGDDTPTNNSSNNSNNSNITTNATFDGSIVTVDPVPAGYELLAVKNVTADNENIDGIKDALAGFSGYYARNSSNIYLNVFQTENNSSAKAYVQAMIDANKEKYPQTSNVTTTKVNGHDATLITTTVTSGGSDAERYVLAWTNGSYLVVVNGPAAFDELKTIADASKL